MVRGSFRQLPFVKLTVTYEKKKTITFFLLSSNLAAITAWANDFRFEDYVKEIFRLCKKR